MFIILLFLLLIFLKFYYFKNFKILLYLISFSNVISINEYFDARGYNHTTLYLNKLLYGDFLIEVVSLDDEPTGLIKLTGLRIDNDGNLKGSWNFPNNLTVSPNYGFVEYQNGTVSLAINEVDNFTWKIMSSTLEDPIIYGKIDLIVIICKSANWLKIQNKASNPSQHKNYSALAKFSPCSFF